MINVKLVSKTSNRIIEKKIKAIDLLEFSEDSLIDEINDNKCCCNTESGYSYCGCRDEFEECVLYVDGTLIITY